MKRRLRIVLAIRPGALRAIIVSLALAAASPLGSSEYLSRADGLYPSPAGVQRLTTLGRYGDTILGSRPGPGVVRLAGHSGGRVLVGANALPGGLPPNVRLFIGRTGSRDSLGADVLSVAGGDWGDWMGGVDMVVKDLRQWIGMCNEITCQEGLPLPYLHVSGWTNTSFPGGLGNPEGGRVLAFEGSMTASGWLTVRKQAPPEPDAGKNLKFQVNGLVVVQDVYIKALGRSVSELNPQPCKFYCPPCCEGVTCGGQAPSGRCIGRDHVFTQVRPNGVATSASPGSLSLKAWVKAAPGRKLKEAEPLPLPRPAPPLTATSRRSEPHR